VTVSFIRTEPGMFDEYLRYLASAYKHLMEENGSLAQAASASAERGKMRKEIGSQLVRQLILK
jgi:hypothetical protein